MAKSFNGVINLDVRDSIADWGPYREEPAPEGAPNVLIVLVDEDRSEANDRADQHPDKVQQLVALRYVDDEVVAEAPLKTQPGHFALCGEGLTIGRDSGDPVSSEYGAGFPFTGGKIVEVEVNLGDDVYPDVERDFAAAMARD
jgi:hypothetical protein